MQNHRTSIVKTFLILVAQIIQKIRSEPFLFVIAITALLLGYAASRVDLGSSILRMIILIVAILASIVILGYYVLAASHELAKLRLNHPTTEQTGLEGKESGTALKGRTTRYKSGDLSELYDLLNNRLDNVEFDAFCSKYFQEVKNKFSEGMRKDAKVVLLIDDCVRHRTTQKLADALRHELDHKSP